MAPLSLNAAEDKLTDEDRAKGITVQDPRWGYRTIEEPSGILHPPFFNISAIKDLRERNEIRSHDVVVTTYPKCGTVWMSQIVFLLLNGSHAEKDPIMGPAKWFEATASMAFNSDDGPKNFKPMSVDDLLALPPPPEKESGMRTWVTHSSSGSLPWKNGVDQAKEVGAKIVIVCRNPKDAAISKYYHSKSLPVLGYDGELENFLPLFLAERQVYNSFWDWHRDWWNTKEKNPETILWVHFEDLKRDLKKEITRISKFLDLERTEEELEKVTERCTFKAMKDESNKRGDMTAKKNHFRSGKSGGWKNVMTAETVAEFDAKTEKMYEECTLRFFDE